MQRESKFFLASMTIWGLIMTGWPYVAQLVGSEVPDDATLSHMKQLGESVLGQISTLVGLAVTALGIRRSSGEKLTVLPKKKAGGVKSPVAVSGLAIVLVLAVIALSGCMGSDRYSDDPAAARIQGLHDFCIGYGALRDGAVGFIEVDVARNDPVLTIDMIEGFQQAREFIRPFCSEDFDPITEPFNLDTLEDQLRAIRLILVKQEG